MSELPHWDFHELLFHARSRWGRHRDPVGATWKLAGRVGPPPALRVHEGPQVALERAPDAPSDLYATLHARTSIREYGERAITLTELGHFLDRVARLRERWEIPVPGTELAVEAFQRPWPGGGALYPLEIHVAAVRCEGLEKALYHFAPRAHALTRLTDEGVDTIASFARIACPMLSAPQLIFVITARMSRMGWKYSGLSYATILKDVGALYQTMYLVATAMRLAPCALGCGNPDHFGRLAGLDYGDESSVGEFLLGSRP